MNMKSLVASLVALGAATSGAFAAAGDVQITEFAYRTLVGEYIEARVFAAGGVDFTDWTFDDSSANPASGFDLSGLGSRAQGDVVIITEVSAAVFEQAWYTDAGVSKPANAYIIGCNNQNLGNGDAINIYDDANQL